MIEFKNLDLKLEPNSLLVNPKIQIPRLVDADITIEAFVITASSGVQLFDLSVDPIHFNGRDINTLDPKIIIRLNETLESSKAAGSLIKGAILAQPSILDIGLQFAGDGGLNTLFSILKLSIPIDKLLWDKPTATLSAKAQSINSSTDATINWRFLNGGLNVDDCIRISINSFIKILFPVNVAIPYFAIDVGLDDIEALKLSIEGLNLAANADAANNLAVSARFGGDSKLPLKLATLLNAFFTSKPDIPGDLVIKGITSINDRIFNRSQSIICIFSFSKY